MRRPTPGRSRPPRVDRRAAEAEVADALSLLAPLAPTARTPVSLAAYPARESNSFLVRDTRHPWAKFIVTVTKTGKRKGE